MTRLRRRTFVVRAATVMAAAPWMGCGDDTSGDAQTGTQTGTQTGGVTDGSSGNASGPSGTNATAGSSGNTVTGSSGETTDGPTTGADGSTAGSESGQADATGSSSGADSTGPAACEATPDDIEGPFYREGIPVGSNLDVHGDAGLPLLLGGRVMDEGCAPIVGAVVEIWHATPRAPGEDPGDNDATYDNTATYRYYGQVATDDQGRYAFETLRPGWYLNGAQYRPAHVHIKVWVRGVERLTSQLYFDDDPFNRDDAWFNPVMSLAPDEGGAATIDLVV